MYLPIYFLGLFVGFVLAFFEYHKNVKIKKTYGFYEKPKRINYADKEYLHSRKEHAADEF